MKTKKDMVMVKCFMIMVKYMKDNGKIIKEMEMALYLMQMVK